MVLLLAGLVLDVLGLLSLVNAGVGHELVILLLRLCLSSAGLRLKTCKVGLDDLDHPHNAAILGAHALVRLIENLRLLHECSGLSGFCVELLEHAEGLSDSSLSILGIL